MKRVFHITRKVIFSGRPVANDRNGSRKRLGNIFRSLSRYKPKSEFSVKY